MPTIVARLIRLVSRVRPLQTRVSRAQAWVIERSRGRHRRSIVFGGGQPVLSLTTTGRRSGARRSTTVAYLRDGANLVVTGVNLGNERPPAWVLNLDANPSAEVFVEGERRAVRARRAAGAERDRLWTAWVHRLPATETFQRIAGREIPVVVLEPV